jgi:hypothetical protein
MSDITVPSQMPKSLAAPARALVNPRSDVMLVGGLSIFTLAIFWILTDEHFLHLDLKPRADNWAFYLAFAVNYPHFAYSYLLFYPGLFRRLRAPETTLLGKLRLFTAGILVPIVAVVFFTIAWRSQDTKYLSWATYSMIFTVGWHYCKQGYGVLITSGLYQNVFYNLWEKRVLYVNAYLVWIYSFLRVNNGGSQDYYDIKYGSFVCPEWLLKSSILLCGFSGAAAAGVLLNHWLRYKKGISLAAVTGYFMAIYMWVLFPFWNMTFYVFIPLFHSLQYLPFVYKFKRTEYLRAKDAPTGNTQRATRRALIKLFLFTIGGYVLGALFFKFIPDALFDCCWVYDLDPQFYTIAFLTTINVHHYFIDAAFWRRDNTDVQKNLFRA